MYLRVLALMWCVLAAFAAAAQLPHTVTIKESFIYGPHNGDLLTEANCVVIIGSHELPRRRHARHVFVYHPERLQGGVLDAYLTLQRNVNMYTDGRSRRCQELYKRALTTVAADARRQLLNLFTETTDFMCVGFQACPNHIGPDNSFFPTAAVIR